MFAVYIASLEYNRDSAIINTVSFIILTVEIALKILAFGLFNKQNGFFKNSWNFFDFILWALILIFTFIRNESYPINFTFYRIFHVLKLLKVKEFIYLLAGIFSSFKAMVNFLLIISIFVIFFSLASTFLFSGALERRCFSPSLGLTTSIFCRQIYECSNDYVCGTFLFANPDNGVTNFDNYYFSMLQIIRIITFQSFSYIVILMEQVFSNFVQIYFIAIGLFGNFFFINLILAVLKVKYSEYKERFMKNQKITEFEFDIHTKTYDLREAQSRGILLKQKLKHTRRFIQKFFRNKASRKLFMEKGHFYISLALQTTGKSFSSTPYSGKTPSEYRHVKKASNTPLSFCLRRNYPEQSSVNNTVIMTPKIDNLTDFIKKSRLSIKKNRAFDSQTPDLPSSPYRKSIFSTNNNKRHFSDLNRMCNFHQIFVNRIVKRENYKRRSKKNEDESSFSQIGSSKSNAVISGDELKSKETSLIGFLLVKILRLFQNKCEKLEKKMESFYDLRRKKTIDISFLSKRIKTEMVYESDSVEEVLPTM